VFGKLRRLGKQKTLPRKVSASFRPRLVVRSKFERCQEERFEECLKYSYQAIVIVVGLTGMKLAGVLYEICGRRWCSRPELLKIY